MLLCRRTRRHTGNVVDNREKNFIFFLKSRCDARMCMFDETQLNDREKRVSRCSNVVEKFVRIRKRIHHVRFSLGSLKFRRTNNITAVN